MKASLSVWMVLMLASGLMSGCAKDTSVSPITRIEQDGKPKASPPFIFYGGPFSVQNANNCPYGSLPTSLHVDVDAFQSGTKNLVIDEGSCSIDANNLVLSAGSTAGSYGPYYYITPTGTSYGISVRRLKIRVKNVSGSVYSDYNKEFFYDASTNAWTWSLNASNYFDITTVTGGWRCN